MKLTHPPLCLLLAFAWAPACCWGAAANGIAAIVNDEIITVGEVEERAKKDVAEIRAKVTGPDRARLMKDRRRFWLNFLVKQHLLTQAAHKAFEATEERKAALDKLVKKELKKQARRAKDLSPGQGQATQGGLSREERDRLIRDDIMVRVYVRNMVDAKVSVSPKEIRAYYDKHADQFSQRKRVRIRQIFVKYSHFKKVEGAWQYARKIEERIKAGDDFGSLVRAYSHGPRAETENVANAGLFDFDEVHSLKHKVHERAMAMKEGDVSPIIASDEGLFIIKAEKVEPARKMQFDEAQGEIKQILIQGEKEKRLRLLLQDLEEKALVKRLRFRE